MGKGEKSTAYFCRLEIKHQERNTVKTLITDGIESSDAKLTAKE